MYFRIYYSKMWTVIYYSVHYILLRHFILHLQHSADVHLFRVTYLFRFYTAEQLKVLLRNPAVATSGVLEIELPILQLAIQHLNHYATIFLIIKY